MALPSSTEASGRAAGYRLRVREASEQGLSPLPLPTGAADSTWLLTGGARSHAQDGSSSFGIYRPVRNLAQNALASKVASVFSDAPDQPQGQVTGACLQPNSVFFIRAGASLGSRWEERGVGEFSLS